jgi:2-(1,2-epoxy-1,2-dihydrophenyl)acetyl-CoA isomerase
VNVQPAGRRPAPAGSDGAGIVVEQPADGVAVVMLNRPHRRNALRRSDWIMLADTLTALDREDSVDAVVLTGRDVFCAGVDMKTSDPVDPEFSALTGTLREVHSAVDRLRTMAKPTVCAVEKYAIGPGLSLAVAADVVVAATDAYFASPRVDLGMLPDAAVAWALSQTMGYHRSYAIVCLGRRLSAEAAADHGLVYETTEPGTALDRAVALSLKLTLLPPDTLRLAKRLLRAAVGATFEAATAAEPAAVALNKLSPSAAAARDAFFNQPPEASASPSPP